MRFTSSPLSNLLVELILSLWVFALCGQATAQTSPLTPITSAPLGRPLWKELSDSQQQALAPLAEQWPTMTEPHKRKWLALSKNFSQLFADEQITLQSRMREWAALSPQKRTAARLNFAGLQQLPQEDKKAKWETYQALSPQTKRKLAEQQAAVPIAGAAPAVKPMTPNKLTAPPAATGYKLLPRIETNQVAPITLLPPNTSSATTGPTAPYGSEGAGTP